MLLLFNEAGIFLTRSELEKLLLLRRQTDIMLLEKENSLGDKTKESEKT